VLFLPYIRIRRKEDVGNWSGVTNEGYNDVIKKKIPFQKIVQPYVGWNGVDVFSPKQIPNGWKADHATTNKKQQGNG
jgi:hypothetical protein